MGQSPKAAPSAVSGSMVQILFSGQDQTLSGQGSQAARPLAPRNKMLP